LGPLNHTSQLKKRELRLRALIQIYLSISILDFRGLFQASAFAHCNASHVIRV
jgi:hypothetical protein